MSKFFSDLAGLLPKLRSQIQLTGLIVTVAGFLIVRQVAPDALPAQLSAGFVGISLVLFANVLREPILRLIKQSHRAVFILVAFLVFVVASVYLIIFTIGHIGNSDQTDQIEKNVQSYLRLGVNCASALTEAKRLVQLTPNRSQSHRLLGNSYYCGSNFEKAEEAFTVAMNLDPRDWRPKFNLAYALLQSDDADDIKNAQKLFLNISDSLGRESETQYGRAVANLLLKKHGKAEELFEKVFGELGAEKTKAKTYFGWGLSKILSSGDWIDNDGFEKIKLATKKQPYYSCILFGNEIERENLLEKVDIFDVHDTNPYFAIVGDMRNDDRWKTVKTFIDQNLDPNHKQAHCVVV